jgi:hypothetical protein
VSSPRWKKVPFIDRRNMMSKGHRPAGGIASNKRVDVDVRTGAGSKGIRPAHVAQRGIAVDPKSVEPRETMKPTGNSVPFGNECALRVGKGGPGADRTILRSGQQGLHGSTNPGNAPAKNRDILSEYGPDYKR